MPNYVIEIKFESEDNIRKLFEGNSGYHSSDTKSDKVTIFSDHVTITAKRSAQKTEPLSHHNSTFHKQVIKSVCLYYAMARKPNQIKEILVSEERHGKFVKLESISGMQLKQAVSKQATLGVLQRIRKGKADLVLTNTDAGRAVLNAVTYLIKSNDTSSVFDRFERLWRAFNALYRAFAKQKSDHDCHVSLRNHIVDRPDLFPLSIAKVATLDADGIRAKMRWNAMILNNHPTPKLAKALKESIMRVEDSRILEIYKSTLGIRRNHIAALPENALTQVEQHIDGHLASKTKRDADVVATLCIKYMYFVRNKMAHAERADHGFGFMVESADEKEINWLAPFLEMLVIDMINLSDTF